MSRLPSQTQSVMSISRYKRVRTTRSQLLRSRFVTARRYASAVYAVIVCPSVRLSVCLSVCPPQVGFLPKRLNLES